MVVINFGVINFFSVKIVLQVQYVISCVMLLTLDFHCMHIIIIASNTFFFRYTVMT